MTRTILVSLVVIVFLLAFAVADDSSITVDCSKGQSLNHAPAQLDKHQPATVSVKGTCTEYVHLTGFDGLLLKGQPGAKPQQPTTSPGNLLNAVLLIQSSRGVTVDGLTIQANTTTDAAVGIIHGSSDIRLRSLNVLGGFPWGMVVVEHSQVSIPYDVPGAGTRSGQGTVFAYAINAEGAIVGWYVDANGARTTAISTRVRTRTTDVQGKCINDGVARHQR